jgi:hypothetical protein
MGAHSAGFAVLSAAAFMVATGLIALERALTRINSRLSS